MPLHYPLKLLARLHLWNARNSTPNAILERYYEKRLYGDACLHDLPVQPMLHILTTNVSSGGLSVFNRNGLFIQDRDRNHGDSLRHVPGQLASIPKVVGASSAFPGLFPPIGIDAADLGVREGQFPTEYFTDGGVFDNLGLRAFSWLKQQGLSIDQVFVSDAGKPFQILADASLGVLGQALRSSDIVMDRVWQLELENFGAREGFVFFPMTHIVDVADDPSAMHPVVQAEVQSIRTDLDRFSDLEVTVLARHGYEVSRSICRKARIFDDESLPDIAPWAPPLSSVDEPEADPGQPGDRYPTPETRISRKLRSSSYRRIWSTLLDWRDWPSYLYAAAAFLLVFLAPFKLYHLYETSLTQKAIISAIKTGDHDIHQILDLVAINPTVNWVNASVADRPIPSGANYDGFELVEHNRIIDLRHWDPTGESPAERGLIYLRDRITLKRTASDSGDGHVTFQVPVRGDVINFRQPKGTLQGTISRITDPVDYYGKPTTVYEFDYDFSEIQPDEPVTIVMEALLDYPLGGRAPFVTHTKTNMISVWLLFPVDRPYRTYSLTSYPLDGSAPPSILTPRYDINHPYGSLIGWSVLNPKENHVYECRWTTE